MSVARLPTATATEEEQEISDYEMLLVGMEKELQPVLELVWPKLYSTTLRDTEKGLDVDSNWYGSLTTDSSKRNNNKKGVAALLNYLINDAEVDALDAEVDALDDLELLGANLEERVTETDQLWYACWQSALTPITFGNPTRLDTFCTCCQLLKLMDAEYLLQVLSELKEDNPDISAQALVQGLQTEVKEWRKYNRSIAARKRERSS